MCNYPLHWELSQPGNSMGWLSCGLLRGAIWNFCTADISSTEKLQQNHKQHINLSPVSCRGLVLSYLSDLWPFLVLHWRHEEEMVCVWVTCEKVTLHFDFSLSCRTCCQCRGIRRRVLAITTLKILLTWACFHHFLNSLWSRNGSSSPRPLQCIFGSAFSVLHFCRSY